MSSHHLPTEEDALFSPLSFLIVVLDSQMWSFESPQFFVDCSGFLSFFSFPFLFRSSFVRLSAFS